MMLRVVALLMLCSAAGLAQTSVPAVSMVPDAVASFSVDWPEAEVPRWSIQVSKGVDGGLVGRYDRLDVGAKPSAETMRAIVVSKATAERLRGGYKTAVIGNCETKSKHLAQTGVKSIAYARPGSDVWASCTFNYSDDKDLMEAVAAFQAIAETIQLGEKLEHTHRFDRLGLDAQLEFLTAEAKEGRAIELGNIAPVLQSIVEDERVIDRARRKAARLLEKQ
jgi:hypothetical protein